MPIHSMGPRRVDVPELILKIIGPLQGFLNGSGIASEPSFNIWGLLEWWEHLDFDDTPHSAWHDIAGQGEMYERAKEAKELSWHAFRSVFGDTDFSEVKNRALRAALCEATGEPCLVETRPEEVEQGKQFFRAWYAEARKYERQAA